MSPASTTNPRRAKPLRFGKRRTLRLGADEEAAVEYMRKALARQRGVDLEKVKISEALRLLLGENLRAARVLASEPGELAQSETVDLPEEFWDGLTKCGNRLSHSQGSLYVIMRKLNFRETVSEDEVRDAFEAVQDSKTAIARLEALGVALVTPPAGADAEADTEAA